MCGVPAVFLWYNIDVNCDNKKDMCDICPGGIELVKIAVYVMLFISLLVFLKTKKLFLSVIIFLVGINIVLLLESFNNSIWFRAYNLEWLQYFSLFIWPVINIILVIWYVRRKK